MKKFIKVFTNGLIAENPIFRLLLGMCSTLALSTQAVNGIGMGLAVTFVLVGSNVIISLLRKVIPDTVRIPCYVVIIATFVTIVQLVIKAYLPSLDASMAYSFRLSLLTASSWEEPKLLQIKIRFCSHWQTVSEWA